MEETRALLAKAHQGDKSAREQLVLDNMGLVWSIVRRFCGRGCESEDLFQIGCIGLIKAIDKFDLAFDVCFSTYAVPMITGEIRRFLRDDGVIRVSRTIKELGGRVKGAREQLSFRLGREPTIEEIARELGVSQEEVAASLEAGAQVESLYQTPGRDGEGGSCLLDRMEDMGRSGEQEQLLNRMVLEELIGQLEEKEKEIIVRRYFENQTQTQVAQTLGVSQVQISRLEKKILKQMRARL